MRREATGPEEEPKKGMTRGREGPLPQKGKGNRLKRALQSEEPAMRSLMVPHLQMRVMIAGRNAPKKAAYQGKGRQGR